MLTKETAEMCRFKKKLKRKDDLVFKNAFLAVSAYTGNTRIGLFQECYIKSAR